MRSPISPKPWGRSDADPRTLCPSAADLFIPDFIAGEQEDAGEDWVSYRLRDGSIWRDGVADTPTPKLIPHRPCPTCGSTTFRVGPGKGPHIAELICTGCERGGRWLSKMDAVAMGVAA